MEGIASALLGGFFSIVPLIELVGFVLITKYALKGYRRTKELEPNIRSGSGYKIKKLFLIWVTTALLIKVALLIFWVVAEAAFQWQKRLVSKLPDASTAHAIYKNHEARKTQDRLAHRKGWIRNLCRLVPNLLFLTSYLLVVGLWVNATVKARNLSPNGDAVYDDMRLGQIIVLTNLVLYASFFTVTVVEAAYSDFELFRQLGFYVIGIAYLALAVVWLYWGHQVIITLKERSTVETFKADLREPLRPGYANTKILLSSPESSAACPGKFTSNSDMEGGRGGRLKFKEDFQSSDKTPSKPRGYSKSDETLKNMRILVYTGACLFFLKGLYNLCVATGSLDKYVPTVMPSFMSRVQCRLLWDGIVGILTEALPICLVVFLVTPRSLPNQAATPHFNQLEQRSTLQSVLASRYKASNGIQKCIPFYG